MAPPALFFVRHSAKMQNDSFKCVSIMRLIIEVKNPTE